MEVIVVSDGHDSETTLMMGETQWGLPVKFFEIEKSQQGVARNRGVSEAGAEIVMFIGDDAFLAPDACEKHLNAHTAHTQPIAVLGFTTWDTALEITPAMKWLEKTGWQFGYPMLNPYQHAFVPKDMQHRFTYTINISLPTRIAKAIPFRTDVTLYGWEDILWGQQLRDADIPLYYEPDATASSSRLAR
jgi:glycosyltransferase involved in cell wall biosynthesis